LVKRDEEVFSSQKQVYRHSGNATIFPHLPGDGTWDKEFGFLKEIMVAPVKRSTIVLGKTAGGVTTALIQGLVILVLALPFGLKLTGIYPQFTILGFFLGFLASIGFMILIGFTFVGLGVSFASSFPAGCSM